MKIAHLTSVHHPFDTRILYKEAATLAAAGHEVVLVAAGAPDATVQGVRIRSVRRGSSRWKRMTATTFAMLRAALAERADVYHFHDPELIPAGIWLKLSGKRVIYDVHDDLPGQVLSKYWIQPWLRHVISRASAAVEALGAAVVDGVIVANPAQGHRFPARKTKVVRNLPDLGEFPGGGTPLRQRANAVGYVGDLTQVRGAKEMVQAIALLPEACQARLLLGGRFSEPGLEAVCRALPGWGRVDFLGWLSRPEVADLLSRIRIGLVLLHPVPHYLTNYPVKLFEYMAVGVPVVASDVPVCRAVVEETGCGLVVDPLDPAAIARAIQWLLEHPDDAEEMARRGRQAVLDHYNWSSEGQELVRYYERFRGGKDPTPAAAGAGPRQ